MRISKDSRINQWGAKLLALGWQLAKGRHPKLVSPDGKITLIVPSSPSDHRTALNWRSDVRRLTGIDLAAA